MAEVSTSQVLDAQLFRDAFNASPIGIAVENLDGQPIFVNPAFCRFLGFTEEELRRKHCVDFSPREDAEKDWALFQQLKAGSIDHYQMEKRYFRRDGSLVWGSLSISLLKGRSSALVLAMVEDITEKKTAEEARFRHAAVIESSDDAIASGNLDGIIVTWNAGAEKMYGYSEAEAVGKPITMLVPPELPDEENKILETLRAGHRVEHFETIRVTKAGKRINVSLTISPIKDSSGKTVGISGIARDITERKRAEEVLRDSEERFRSIFREAGVGMVIVSPEGRFLAANKAFCDILGYSEDELLEKTVESITFPEDWPPFSNKLREALSERLGFQWFEKRCLHKSGRIVHTQSSTSLILNREGNPLYFVGEVLDITERKRAEEALRASEERLRLAQQAARIGTFERDRRSGHITWAEGLDSLYGLPPGSVDGKTTAFFNDLIHPEDRKQTAHLIQDALKTGQPTEGEWRAIWPDGSVHWIASRWQVLMDESGEPSRVMGVNMDITERKGAEEALRASEERLRLAQSAAHIGTFDLNLRTGVDIWQPETEALYGLPPGGFGRTLTAFEDLIHPNDRERVKGLTQEMMRTGQTTEAEWRVVWPDGSIHWIAARCQILTDASGERSRVIGVNMDVTERKHAEQALRANEELLKIFVKNVPAAVAMLDRDMRYLQVSDRWCSDYLAGREQVLGRSHYELFPDMPGRWKEVHRRALAGETLRADEDHWDGEDGPHWARWEVRPWRTSDGSVGGILILAEDITRRKQMEEAIADMSRKLIDAQEQERARIGRELHDDINQRLALLALDLQQVEHNPSEAQTRVRKIRKELDDISSDVEALSHELHSSKLQYLGVLAGIKSWCKDFAERQRVEVDFRGDACSPIPHEIGLSLFRVLQEAIHNSVKHSGVKRVEVEIRQGGSAIHVMIRDSGKGFDVESAMHGKGLGLTSMRERVRLINGTISIDSKPQHGTTIHVRVPFDSGYAVDRKAV